MTNPVNSNHIECSFFQNILVSSIEPQIMSSEDIRRRQTNEKILRYETFVNERLKPDLKSVLEERDQVYDEIAEYIALRNTIHAIK